MKSTEKDSAYITSEARWFLRQPFPACDRFISLEGSERRIDEYLFPLSRQCSVKWRQGAFETKLQVSSGQTENHGGLRYDVADWIKWRTEWSASYPPRGVSHQKGDSRWIPVTKQRWLHRFTWGHDRKREIRRATADDSPKVEFEIGNIILAETGEQWWTLCFESSGAKDQRRAFLETVIEHFLKHQWLDTSLNEEICAAYPEWLARKLTIEAPGGSRIG